MLPATMLLMMLLRLVSFHYLVVAHHSKSACLAFSYLALYRILSIHTNTSLLNGLIVLPILARSYEHY